MRAPTDTSAEQCLFGATVRGERKGLAAVQTDEDTDSVPLASLCGYYSTWRAFLHLLFFSVMDKGRRAQMFWQRAALNEVVVVY